jgi:RNase P/RNase MRP subunit p29
MRHKPQGNLAGKTARILESTQPSYRGIIGKVVNETKYLLWLEMSDGTIRRIIKSHVQSLMIDEEEVPGKAIQGRIEERIRK